MAPGFWLNWLLASFAFSLGGGLTRFLVGPADHPGAALAGGLIVGVLLGGGQWIPLRKFLPVGGAWIAATTIGTAIGIGSASLAFGGASTISSQILSWLIAGVAVGCAQWTVLRKATKDAIWWIPCVSVAWASGWGVSRAVGVAATEHFVVFGFSGAFVFQVVLGAMVRWLGKGKGAR